MASFAKGTCQATTFVKSVQFRAPFVHFRQAINLERCITHCSYCVLPNWHNACLRTGSDKLGGSESYEKLLAKC
jgi:hypothetical protein